MKKITVLLSLCFSIGFLHSVSLNYDKALRNLKGVKAYEKGDQPNAKENFENNSIKDPKDGRLHYNLANSYYRQNDLSNAEQEYQRALKDRNFNDKSSALQNLGNVYFQQRDFKKALENYKASIMEDPQNQDARYNYELAAKFLDRQQNQQQQQNQDQNQDQKKDDKKNDKQQQQQDQQNKEQQEKQQQQQQQQQQQSDQKNNEQKEKEKQQMKKEGQSKDDKEMEDMLKAVMDKEKQEMKKRKEIKETRRKSGKYW